MCFVLDGTACRVSNLNVAPRWYPTLFLIPQAYYIEATEHFPGTSTKSPTPACQGTIIMPDDTDDDTARVSKVAEALQKKIKLFKAPRCDRQSHQDTLRALA